MRPPTPPTVRRLLTPHQPRSPRAEVRRLEPLTTKAPIPVRKLRPPMVATLPFPVNTVHSQSSVRNSYLHHDGIPGIAMTYFSSDMRM